MEEKEVPKATINSESPGLPFFSLLNSISLLQEYVKLVKTIFTLRYLRSQPLDELSPDLIFNGMATELLVTIASEKLDTK